MTVKGYRRQLIQKAKDKANWTPELFKEYQKACLMKGPCIFNELRRELSKSTYEEFDKEYCEYFRPGHSQKKKERGDKQWLAKKRDLLQKKKQLLLQILQT